MARTRARSEFERIERIERILARGAAPGVELGIGDDAAVIRARGRLVWSIDSQVERVHFDRRWLSEDAIGFRSFMAAASDLAAMGARPIAALANLSLPRGFSERALERLVRGQAEAAERTACPIVGGNLSRAAELSLTTTVIGAVTKPLLRSGARAGDELWLDGDVGLAAAGLAALQRRLRAPGASLRRCIESWRRPEARLASGRRLVGRARAAIDVSDGLAGDAAHVARASGVRVAIDAALLRTALAPELFTAAEALGLSALDLALFGGEDYALLATGPSAHRPRGAKPVGRIVKGRGVVLTDERGVARPLGGSFDHFEAPPARGLSGSRRGARRRAEQR